MDPAIPITIRDNKGNIVNINNEAKIVMENLKNTGFTYKGQNLYFENKKRITPERRFEIEFERLLKEESRTKLKSSEDNSIVSFFSNMENNIVQNESVRERFENERFKKSQTISSQS